MAEVEAGLAASGRAFLDACRCIAVVAVVVSVELVCRAIFSRGLVTFLSASGASLPHKFAALMHELSRK